MRKLLTYLVKNFEEIVLSLLFMNMCVFVLIQIVSRYVFRSPLLFTEEVSRYSYVWITFFGMAIATKLENHIKIDLLFILLKGKAQIILNILVDVLSFFLYIVLFIIGFNYTVTNMIQLSPAMEISKGFIYVSLPLGAFFSIVRLLAIIKKEIDTLRMA